MVFEESAFTICDENGNPKTQYQWENKSKIASTHGQEPAEDLKFCPITKGHILATCNADGKLYIYDLSKPQDPKQQAAIQISTEPCTCLSWNKNLYDPEMIVVGSKSSPKIDGLVADKSSLSLWMKKNIYNWVFVNDMTHNGIRHVESVYDVSWALLNGRSFHYIASCGVEGVYVWRLQFDDKNNAVFLDVKTFKPDADSIPVCVSWNLMATLLVVSSSNSMVSIWKRTKDFNWQNLSLLYGIGNIIKNNQHRPLKALSNPEQRENSKSENKDSLSLLSKKSYNFNMASPYP